MHGPLEGCLLKNRYQIGKFIDNGQQGCVYTVTDTKRDDKRRPLIIKVARNSKLFTKEIKTMTKVHKIGSGNKSHEQGKYGSVPKVKDYGHIFQISQHSGHSSEINKSDLDNGILLSYMIAPRYGSNL